MTDLHATCGIALRTSGTHGSPVLLLHGIGGSSESFAHQLPALGTCHRVYAWDAPGYGESACLDAPPGMAGYADRVTSLLTALELEDAHLVGVSWGGVIATRVALRHPHRVRSLVLAGSSRGSGVTRQSSSRMRNRAQELADLGVDEFARARGPRLTAPQAPTSVVEHVVSIMRGLRAGGYRAAVESMAETDHSALLERITVPTLALAGQSDRVTGPEESKALVSGIPGAQLRIIRGGHAANQEHPDEFNETVATFLSAVDSRVPAGGL